MNKSKIILASASPARKATLEQLGISFEIDISDIDETPIKNLYSDPTELVLKLAEAKAENVAKKYNDAIVIGSDTMVIFENKILGKPKNTEEAITMLMSFAGKEQHIISGFCVIDTSKNDKVLNFLDTKVIFKNYSKNEIKKYVSTTLATKRAGGYKLEEVADIGWVAKYKGSRQAGCGMDMDYLKTFSQNK